jgi:hypothetical protein
MSTELRFQVADIYGTHTLIITNLTMLVMSIVDICLRKTRSLGSSAETAGHLYLGFRLSSQTTPLHQRLLRQRSAHPVEVL